METTLEALSSLKNEKRLYDIAKSRYDEAGSVSYEYLLEAKDRLRIREKEVRILLTDL